MKIKSLIIVGLLGLTSCANQAQPFYITNFFPLASGCGTGNAEQIAQNGYLDVAAGAAQFFIGARIIGGQGLVQREVRVGGSVLESENRNRPIITQAVVSYRLSKRVGATPKPYITNLTLPFVEDDALTSVQLISPDLATALFDGLAPSPGLAPSATIEDFVDISADLEFKGELSATRTPFSTGTLTFPIRAYRSNPSACTNGFVKLFSDPANNNATDNCRYVGQTTSQNEAPQPPAACCITAGSAGGAGC